MASRTAAAGAIGLLHSVPHASQEVCLESARLTCRERTLLKGQKASVLWFTGLSASGKSTIAGLVEKKLHFMGRHVYLLEGDDVRRGLNKDLGFTDQARIENIRRIAEVSKLMVDAGLIVLTACISPFLSARAMARQLFNPDEFIEIYIDTPLAVAEQRDPKGLYIRARRGELRDFTGIDSPYEAPETPELRLSTVNVDPETAANIVIEYLVRKSRF